MKKGVYNMPNIYVKENRGKNIYLVDRSIKKQNPKKTISQGLTNDCIENLSQGLNEFVAAIIKTMLQER